MKRLLLFIAILISGLKLQAQQTVPLFFEKVYLHTDRDVYAQGEDIWFKAYLINAQNSKLINYSHNLYVELINLEMKVLMRHVVRLEGGLGNGDFKLPDTVSSGTYRLRAYTNWMRNFGDNFIFEKNIVVVNTAVSANAVSRPGSFVGLKKKQAADQDTLSSGPAVRFFPEGGSLIDGVTSVVAVKAEDEFGRGIAVSGAVITTLGKIEARFICDSLGFGTFSLTPGKGTHYSALVKIGDHKVLYKIHDAVHNGFAMSANAAAPLIITSITCNTSALYEHKGEKLVVVGRHGGKTVYKDQILVQSKDLLVQIPDTNFPEGIACITLYDEHSVPLCERLVYVHHCNSTTLNITTDSASYHSRQKVTIKIKLSDSTLTHLSLTAVDAGVIPASTGDIRNYLALTSEIKGPIEHPERYFDTINVNRFKQLDLLLLTQGWRDFVWTKIADTIFKLSYDVEQSISITGHVRSVWLNKTIPRLNITMFAPRATGDKLFTAVSDSLGNFRIDGAVLYGYQYISFTSRQSGAINNDGTSKGKTGGAIYVDSLFHDQLPVTRAKPIFPNSSTMTVNALLERDKLRQKFTFSGINELKTVEIKRYSSILAPEVHPITIAEQKDYGSLEQYLLYMIPGCHMEAGGCTGGVVYQNQPPVPGPSFLETGYDPPKENVHRVSVTGTYSNYSKLDYGLCDEDFLGLPMDRLLKVTINRHQTVFGIIYSVHVLMRPGALDVKDAFDNTMADIVGYTRARIFYAPKHETPDTKPDYRTTIHWEPNITTDAKGEATVSFYNADPKTKVRIVVEGITDKGVPVVGYAMYEVK